MAARKAISVTSTIGLNIFTITGDILFTICGLVCVRYVPAMGKAAAAKITHIQNKNFQY